MPTAVYIGAGFVALGAVAAALIKRQPRAENAAERAPSLEADA
jgi:hypothetical protein